jgi:uncharacterized glyoxalase superfamily protein PhnB
MAVKPIPAGYHTVTPYLVVRDADRTIRFLEKAFDAEVVFEPLRRPDGRIVHTEIQIGDSRVMIAEENKEHKAKPSMLYVYVPNVDASYQLALAAGGKSSQEPEDQFFGDRTASVRDPSGNQWELATRVEDVSPAELKKRVDKMFKQGRRAA